LGTWRIIYQVDQEEKVHSVVMIEPRGRVYKRI